MINARTLLIYGLGVSFISAIAKTLFFSTLNSDSIFLQIVLQIFVFLVAVAFVRRLGVIHYLEVLFVMGVWLIFCIGIDGLTILVTNNLDVYLKFSFWLTYIVMLLALFLFHKKRHVDIRIKNKKEV